MLTENKSIKLYVILFFLFILLLIGYFCVASFITSFGYTQAYNAKVFEKTVFTSETLSEKITVIIDPGHGGEDPGAVDNGMIEKTLNLEIAFKLNDFLKLSSCDTVMTRTGDVLLYEAGQEERKKFYDLRNRLAVAESFPNGIYVGIHMNKFPIEKYHGLQTFYSDNNDKSRILASLVQESCRMADPANTRLIKPDGNTIFILENIKIPAILIECGFLSNPGEAAKLADEKYQSRLAFLIFCGIEQYTGNAE
ncbi:MAG: N-acetylmuramoyl-L-alanine amidase [Eubacteriales bacterium]|nr:N-acetylmuramoyl-L-alanine amidase [Eubacteriales bacterium]